MGRIKVDLHEIYDNSAQIEEEIASKINFCLDHKIKKFEIIHGKGSGQLKKKVLRFLGSNLIKNKVKRIEKDPKNHGRLFVHIYV